VIEGRSPKGYPGPGCTLYALASLRAAAAGNGLYDLGLFAGTGVLDKMADVDDATIACVGALQAGVVRLYGIVVILGWVRGVCGRLMHVNTSSVLAAPPGSLIPPQIEAPQQARESPQTVEEAPDRAEPRPATGGA